MNETQPIKNGFEALEKTLWNAVEVIGKAFNNVLETILEPLYDRCLLAASAENPKWYYYYKNAKKLRTREKYRILLQDRFFLLLEKAKTEKASSGVQYV